ncbi:hypothetical protein DBT48_02035 [Aerococcus mictus]|uniref:hypothetical protein n=1 Tax=Aerococcus mictus TaxID=2976810 RepID=UPI000DCC912A|nr:hypothetical protein [Aerococcus mictus]RAV75078.1 hypothetical protein DBT48_02035 [Aerococcus mictus]
MDNYEVLNQRLEEYEEKVERTKEFLNLLEVSGDIPQQGDQYWYIHKVVMPMIWDNDPTDYDRLKEGNTYPTKDHCQYELEKDAVADELKALSDVVDDYDWGNKYAYGLACVDEGLYSVEMSYPVANAIMFSSKEKLWQAVDLVGGKRIKDFLFGVIDDE